MNRPKRIATVLLVAVLAIELAAACMEGSTAPLGSRVTATAVVGRTAQPNGLVGSTTSIVDGLVRLVMKVLRIVGGVGGSHSNGRWRVEVPAGAIDGTAAIGLGVPNSSSPYCQLDILPAEKNHFSTPVSLTVDCSSVPQDQLKNYVIFRFDPVTNAWSPVRGSSVDLTRKTVSAPLVHFSTYAVGPSGGKAGW